jgi:predicted nuclease of predicted toxin-antitoxin system
MRILANENFPRDAVDYLREIGHDVAWVRADAPGSSDREVLDRAQSDDRVLLTFDKDFGELAFRSGLPATCGIILLRFTATSSEHVAKTVAEALRDRTDWIGNFSVIEDLRIRMTPLLGKTDTTP